MLVINKQQTHISQGYFIIIITIVISCYKFRLLLSSLLVAIEDWFLYYERVYNVLASTLKEFRVIHFFFSSLKSGFNSFTLSYFIIENCHVNYFYFDDVIIFVIFKWRITCFNENF